MEEMVSEILLFPLPVYIRKNQKILMVSKKNFIPLKNIHDHQKVLLSK
jgi:hypothetical protein